MRLRQLSPIALASATLLGGCATLGGTVKGDFTCRAPAGTCAPMRSIDAAAIEALAALAGPAVPDAAASIIARGGDVPVRTAERTLAIVIPAHVDATGVLHDAATVHALVQMPGWAFAPRSGDRADEISRSTTPSSLREAVAGASAPAIGGLEYPPARAPHPSQAGALSQTAPSAVPTPSASAIAAARRGHRIRRDLAPQSRSGGAVGTWSLAPGRTSAGGKPQADLTRPSARAAQHGVSSDQGRTAATELPPTDDPIIDTQSPDTPR